MMTMMMVIMKMIERSINVTRNNKCLDASCLFRDTPDTLNSSVHTVRGKAITDSCEFFHVTARSKGLKQNDCIFTANVASHEAKRRNKKQKTHADGQCQSGRNQIDT